MKKFYCPQHGEIDHLLFDGYHFGGRKIEGLIFKITLNNDNTHNAEIIDRVPRYMNKDELEKDCVECVSEWDFGRCPIEDCKIEDVSLDGEKPTKEELKYLKDNGYLD